MGQLKEELVLDTSKFSGGIKDAINNIKDLNNASERAGLKKLKGNLDDVTDAVGDNEKEIRKYLLALGGSGKTLQGKIKNIKEELANLADKGKETSSAYKTLVGELQRYTNILSKIASETKEAMDSAKSSVDDLSNSISNMISSLKSGDITSFSKNLQSSMASVKDFKMPELSGTMIKGAGITAVAAGVIAGAKAFVDFNAESSKANQAIQQFTGLGGQALIDFRATCETTAEQFGMSMDDVVKTANTVARQMGVSFQEAADSILDGLNLAVDKDEYKSQMEEYSTYAKEAGMSIDELSTTIIRSQQQGIVSDKAVDSIKEANIRIREMSPAVQKALDAIGIDSKKVMKGLADGSITTFDVMKQVSQKMSEMSPQAQEVGQAISDIFGGPGEDAGYQFLTTIKDIKGNMQELYDNAPEGVRLAKEQMDATEDLKRAIISLFDVSGKGWDEFVSDIKVGAIKAVTKLVNGLKTVVDWLDSINRAANAAFAPVRKLLGTEDQLAKKAAQEMADNLKRQADNNKRLTQNNNTTDKTKDPSTKKLQLYSNELNKLYKQLNKTTDKAVAANIQKRIDAIKKAAKSLTNKLDVVSDNNNKPSSRKSKGITKKSDVAAQGSLDWYSQEISKLSKQLNASADKSVSVTLQSKINELKKAKEDLEKSIKAESLVPVVTPKIKMPTKEEMLKMFNQLSPTVTVKTPQQTRENKREIYSNALTAVSNLQTDVLIGSINKKLAEAELAKINEILQKEGLEPLKLEIDTEGLSLDNLNDSISAIDNIGSSVSNMVSAIEEGASAWEIFTSVVGVVTTTLQSVLTIMNTVKMATDMLTASETANQLVKNQNAQQEVANAGTIVAANTAKGISGATASGSSMPFPMNIVAIAMGVAAVIAAIASISGAFANGGIVNGNGFVGDQNLIRVNGGEAVLTKGQQANLWNILDNGGGTGGVVGGEVRIKGSDLYMALRNYSKVKGTVGKNTGIK